MEWPFSDPKDSSVLTTQEIVDGREPIRYVSHDVDDGAWQFHSGPDFDEESTCLITLGEMVQIDPTLVGLADLALGVSAWRESPSDPWARESMFPTDWMELVAEAVSYVQEVHENVKETFELSTYDQWDYFLDEGVFEWSVKDDVAVHAHVRVAGAFTESDQTWKWSWATGSELPDTVVEGMERVRKFGEHHQLRHLVEPTWKTESFDAWQAACVAGLLMNSEYVFRATVEDGYLFLLLDDLEFEDEDELISANDAEIADVEKS
ncbi:MAG: hypothetical protein KTR25_12590 [Myxococcales bacterium]|nr:hypothetical protein [Myxococcales bacterium]